jgi:hypothetical protein
MFLISVFLAWEGSGCVIAAALICRESYDGLMAAGEQVGLAEESRQVMSRLSTGDQDIC